jgi:hypothetical protein
MKGIDSRNGRDRGPNGNMRSFADGVSEPGSGTQTSNAIGRTIGGSGPK